MNAFKCWRKLLGMTREEAAVSLAVRSRVTLHRYKKGGLPDVRVLVQMMRIARRHSDEACAAFVDYLIDNVPATPPTVENAVPVRAREASAVKAKLTGVALLNAAAAKAIAAKTTRGHKG